MNGHRLRAATAAVAWVGASAVVLRGLTGAHNVFSSLAWLHEPTVRRDPDINVPHVVLILPMLREQRTITETVDYFADLVASWGRGCVAVVTTERERKEREAASCRLPELAVAIGQGATPAQLATRFGGLLPGDQLVNLARLSRRSYPNCLAEVRAVFASIPTTATLATNLAAAQPGIVWHYHLPDPSGTMADQINYAARGELARLTGEGMDPRRIWLGIYNADSRPHPDTLTKVAAMYNRHPDTRVVQQSAVFTRNLRTAAGAAAMFVDGAALLQSRWTLAREITRLRRQAHQARTGRPRGWPHLAHCVGHGLFLRADTFTDLGGLPTTTMNEDLAFGYLACAAGIPIDPLPLLELGDSPSTPRGVARQARQWFWSYPQYPRFHTLAADARHGSRWARTALTAQGLARGGLWLGQSPAILATLLLPVVSQHRRLAALVATGAFASYYAVPTAALIAYLRHHVNQPDARFGARELAGGLAACLVSSAGPWWCVGNAIHQYLTGAHYHHDKTER